MGKGTAGAMTPWCECVRMLRTGTCVSITLSSAVEELVLPGEDGEVRRGEITEDAASYAREIWIYPEGW